jgi:hypothetical protein
MICQTMMGRSSLYQIFLLQLQNPIFSRKIDDNSISQFILLLSYENWEDVFIARNVDIIFNNFLNTYLRIFYTSFPLKKLRYSHNTKPWLTTGIRTSCANKRKLYLLYTSSSNDPNLKKFYKNYCKILSTVIIAAKKNIIIINFY